MGIRSRCRRSLVVVLLILGAPLHAGIDTGSSAPEVPVIDRDVALVVDEQFTRPSIPPMRTSNDGRVALNMKSIGGLAFFLMSPEKIGQPFLESPAGTEILASTTAMTRSPSLFHASTNSPGMHHVTLCDGTPQFPENGAPSNPYPCGENLANDCYDLTVVAAFRYDHDPDNEDWRIEFWGTPITVTVSSPKTASATLESIAIGTPVLGGTFPYRAVFEPMVAEDGRLFTLRLSGTSLTWFNPNTGQNVTTTTDIAYSVGAADATPCDLTQWQEFFPISHAPYDADMQGRYGIAAYPFRDPEGYVIPDGGDIRGTYPWVDSKGANLFMTTVSSRLFWWDGSAAQTRFPIACVPGVACGTPQTQEEMSDFDVGGRTRGVAMAGLWTHGKVVLLDTTINNTDFGLRMPDEKHYMVDLYTPNSGPQGDESGAVRVGTGRYNASAGQPPGSAFNTTFLDSQENLFNAHEKLRPLRSRDVVWILDSGKTSDEVEFDDYVNPNGFILSEMTMSMGFNGGMFYHDGWDGSGFTEPIRVQNSATAPTSSWIIPPYGAVEGNARIEPVAIGGIHGRGLWLNGTSRIRYEIAPQTGNVDATSWFIGLFVDARFPDDGSKRDLIVFPDGSRLQAEGHDRVVFTSGSGAEKASFALPAQQRLVERGWTHLGLTISDAGSRVRLYVNGYTAGLWNASAIETIFRMGPGTLSVGYDPLSAAGGIRGWIDRFKVFAESPDPEVVCNHAGGTLIGLEPGASDPWDGIASSYPTWAHDELSERLDDVGRPSFGRYACYRDYTADDAAHRYNLPADMVRVRDGLLFPEGPLVFGQPRPDSSANSFCLSCHVASHPPTLSPAALTPEPMVMEHDPRRQPTQPPRLIRGNIPAGYFGNGFPSSSTVAPAEGHLQDRWTAAHPDDCDPDQDGVFSSPGDTLNLSFASTIRLVWDPDPINPASTYDLLIGDLDGLTGGVNVLQCVEDLTQPGAFDPTPADASRFFLVRTTSSCGDGGIGTDSSGETRPAPNCGSVAEDVPEVKKTPGDTP